MCNSDKNENKSRITNWLKKNFSSFKKRDELIEENSSALETSSSLKKTEENTESSRYKEKIRDEILLDSKRNKEKSQLAKENPSFFKTLKTSLSKTSSSIGLGIATIFTRNKDISEELWEEIESRLLMSDMGYETTSIVINNLKQAVKMQKLKSDSSVYEELKKELGRVLSSIESPLLFTSSKKPLLILVIGVNGVGKTTTIGKIARKVKNEGNSVLLAAGDTYRAGAIEQLKVWSERNDIPMVAHHPGADSASVIFDALKSAHSRGIDVVIADTAGRLHTKNNLMEELKKIHKITKKINSDIREEILLVLDASMGQNTINQTRNFTSTVPVSGLVLTKLDGTAKGGVIFSLANEFSIPLRFIGIGEGIDDLRVFESKSFIQALFSE